MSDIRGVLWVTWGEGKECLAVDLNTDDVLHLIDRLKQRHAGEHFFTAYLDTMAYKIALVRRDKGEQDQKQEGGSCRERG